MVSKQYFRRVFYLVFTLPGHYTYYEMHTFMGRVNCILEAERCVCLFEFKRDDTVEAVFRQIEEVQYALPYTVDPGKLCRTGVTFDPEQ